MKTTEKLLLVPIALLALALAVAACARGTGRTGSTASPTAGPTDIIGPNTREPALTGGVGDTGEPLTTDADGTGSPVLTGEPSASPGAEGTDAPFGAIDGFAEGKVVDPSEIPQIAEALGRAFPEHTLQSVTCETYHGMNAYRVTLQGDGELARLVYVLGDGTILIPGGGD